ncbi:hypothetical protein POP12_095 [Pectobacterium phage POP12]|nr:hypothetical protein POP12_095 [Pectobacterium phage POP12]
MKFETLKKGNKFAFGGELYMKIESHYEGHCKVNAISLLTGETTFFFNHKEVDFVKQLTMVYDV